jgi:RNA polymerase sigma-70 factor (ECF subfamily)
MAEPPMLMAAYLRKRAELVRFFTRRAGSAEAAEDLVQEIYLKIQGAPDPADLRSPEAYLYRLGSNLLLDRRKQARRQAARESGWVRATVGEEREPVAEEPPADQAVAARQRLAAVVAALDELPRQTALAFRLHKFEGLSHAEVAARLGVSKSAVEKYMIAALRHLVTRIGS